MRYTKLVATVIAAAVLLMGGQANGAVYTVTGETLVLGPAEHNAVFNLDGADIQAGQIVFDYAGGADPAATIRGLLSESYDGGRWDVGQFRNSTATATGLTLGCLADKSFASSEGHGYLSRRLQPRRLWWTTQIRPFGLPMLSLARRGSRATPTMMALSTGSIGLVEGELRFGTTSPQHRPRTDDDHRLVAAGRRRLADGTVRRKAAQPIIPRSCRSPRIFAGPPLL